MHTREHVSTPNRAHDENMRKKKRYWLKTDCFAVEYLEHESSLMGVTTFTA